MSDEVEDKRFSLSLDERTSQQNHRYLNMIVHGKILNFGIQV